MKFDSKKTYNVKHAVDGVYYDGNLRIDDKTAVPVDGDTAKRLDTVKIVYTTTDPNGVNKPDPRPRFIIEEVAAPAPALAPAKSAESAPSGNETAPGGKEGEESKAPATDEVPAAGAASSAPQSRRATPPPQ